MGHISLLQTQPFPLPCKVALLSFHILFDPVHFQTKSLATTKRYFLRKPIVYKDQKHPWEQNMKREADVLICCMPPSLEHF